MHKPSSTKASISGSADPQHLEKQREANQAFFRKAVTERNRKLEDLQKTHTVLEENVSKAFQQSNGTKNGSSSGITKATMAYSLLGELIDDCIYDVLFEAHRDIKQANSICQICQTRCRQYVSRPGCDVFGNTYAANNLPAYECVNCHKMIAAVRYAPHLEKCLGLAGRQSSRVANRRLGSSSPFASSASVPQSIGVSDEPIAFSDPETTTQSDSKKKKKPLPV
ncbi:hypothetical protein BDB00DRAFT_842031 [Zychaea mexicana]|uniref:uncharacterized protein n=1 Tax=Zychaea mexicana TaxID=64656 RepID=UPI0022FE95D8|nr:uncharacterized protein BDB00DRAFT_842031 [Zychaea mexicana]KAI9489689.1 hypothetical protein BDB00DRAFT_842031 [Zychaea mexicana]